MYKYNSKKEWQRRQLGIRRSKNDQGGSTAWKAGVVQERSESHSLIFKRNFADARLGKTRAYRNFWSGIDVRARSFINKDMNFTKYTHNINMSEAQSGKLISGN